ncbi:MAG: hypothetical protein IIB00_04110 [candidate division Zixibacteria bacterium]|nr:hypothetical protein [candidate division Zixibacteria bacterium]
MKYKVAIGPLSTGWHSWTLLLSPETLTAISYSQRDLWKLALNEILGFPKDPYQDFRNKVNDGIEVCIPPNTQRRDYELTSIKSVCAKYRSMRNQIIIEGINGELSKYDISDRSSTNAIFDSLKSFYSTKYRELGKPTTLVGRIWKT